MGIFFIIGGVGGGTKKMSPTGPWCVSVYYSSSAAEHVFSIKSHQTHFLQDYIEAATMCQYNRIKLFSGTMGNVMIINRFGKISVYWSINNRIITQTFSII